MSLLQITPEQLEDACGEDPGAVCEQVLEWTESEFLAEAASWLVERPLKVILIVVGAWIVNRLARRGIARFVREVTNEDAKRVLRTIKTRTPAGALLDTGSTPSLRSQARAETITLVLKGVATGTIWAIALVMILAEVGVNIGPLIAGAGIAGVALGFGAQSLVKDFFSGTFMLIEDQFGVGDIIDVGEAEGIVEAVSLRTTRLRSLDGTVWHVPNGEIHRVGNMSQQFARALLDLDVAYDTDLQLAKDTIKRVADEMWREEGWDEVLLEEPEVWGVQNFGADGISIRLVIKTQPGEQWNVSREFRHRLKNAFDEVGIEIPFPQRTMWIRREEGSSRDAEVDALEE